MGSGFLKCGGRRCGRVIGVLCVVAAAVVVSGCGNGGQQESSAAAPTAPAAAAEQSTAGGLTRDQTARKSLIAAAKIGWNEAADTALGTVPGSKLLDIDLRRDDGGSAQWDTRIAAADGTAHVVNVDAVSGQVARTRVESDQDSGDKRELIALLNSAKISPQQAATTATGRKQGTVSAIGLEDSDGGAAVWSVDVVTTNDGQKTAFDIDSATGDVLREEVDRN